jgi:hypothetical protein
VEPDRTNVKTQLVVTHRPHSTVNEEVEYRDESGNRVVEHVVMDGALGKGTPRLDDHGHEIKRYRTVTQTTTKRGFEWFGEWLAPGDILPDDERLTPRKRINLLESGWIKEVEANKPKGRPKGSKNKKHKKARRKQTPTVAV